MRIREILHGRKPEKNPPKLLPFAVFPPCTHLAILMIQYKALQKLQKRVAKREFIAERLEIIEGGSSLRQRVKGGLRGVRGREIEREKANERNVDGLCEYLEIC